MKKYILNTQIIAFLALLLASCAKEVLNKTPLDRYTGTTVFSDINLADAYLKSCYYNTRHGMTESNHSCVSGECYGQFSSADVYLLGFISPDNPSMWYDSGDADQDGQFRYADINYANWNLFKAVQKINVFIDNIDNVVNYYDKGQKASIKAQCNVMKGEALFTRAFVYSQMCMTYGGLPLFKTANELGEDFSAVTRATFEKTVDFITADCDSAFQRLGYKSEMEMGRATKEAALALKSRILLFAASDLTADGTAEIEEVGYKNPDRTALWTKARNAAKAVMELGTCSLADFGAPDKAAVAKNYYEFFRAYNLSNNEVIWGKMFNPGFAGELNQANLWYGPNGDGCWGAMTPTQKLVDEFEMEDGSKFSDHFEIDNNGYYKNISAKFKNPNIYYDREPRFYGSILYDSAVWQPRVIFPALQLRDPLGIYETRLHRTINDDGSVTEIPGIDTRQGDYTWWNGGWTRYCMKKLQDDKYLDATRGENNVVGNLNVWIEFRYAEIILNYAEACLALGEIPEATTYINMIRNRAALPNFTGDITQALRHERNMELVFENRRWFDIRRWKILDQGINRGITGINIIETKQGNTITTTWQQIQVKPGVAAVNKMYWIPISRSEMNKAPQLIQNPGY